MGFRQFAGSSAMTLCCLGLQRGCKEGALNYSGLADEERSISQIGKRSWTAPRNADVFLKLNSKKVLIPP